MKTAPYLLAVVSLISLIAPQIHADQESRLPRSGIEPSSVTVSGVSSGAFLAVQLHVAYSSQIHGVAAIAGGLYGCAEGDLSTAFSRCMMMPGGIDTKKFVEIARKEAEAGRIDALAGLNGDRVYIFNGRSDRIVRPDIGNKVNEFYQAFVPADRIRQRNDFDASHGWPTENFGGSCTSGSRPYLLKCGFDMAGEILTEMYGPLQPAGEPVEANLTKFDQSEFATAEARLYSDGAVYVPTACRTQQSGCRLHVVLHGCQQNPDFAKDDFRREAGFNRWAETNRIIVLYPTVAVSARNDQGCWDWYGYTTKDYAVQGAPQMDAIRKMIEHLAK